MGAGRDGDEPVFAQRGNLAFQLDQTLQRAFISLFLQGLLFNLRSQETPHIFEQVLGFDDVQVAAAAGERPYCSIRVGVEDPCDPHATVAKGFGAAWIAVSVPPRPSS